MSRRSALAASVAFMLAGCSRSRPPIKPELHRPPGTAAAAAGDTGFSTIGALFVCDDSTLIYALFERDTLGGGDGSVALAINDTRLHLPQLISASGARYGDSTAVFWNKGDSATYTVGDVVRRCAVDRS